MYSNEIFKDMDGKKALITPRTGAYLCGVAYVISGFISTQTVSNLKRRTVLITGHFAMTLFQGGVIVFSLLKIDLGVVIMIIMFIFSYNMSSGPLCWMYSTETMIDVGLGICLGTLLLTNFVLTLACPILMNKNSLGPNAVFGLFSVSCFLGVLYAYFVMVETKGLNDK